MQRIGVFSGTFDPFHIAHLEACLVAKAELELETVVILIEKQPHRKQDVTSYEHRLAIIDLATQEYPSIRMLQYDHDNVTIDNALPVLGQQFGDAQYWYIVGSDMIQHIGDWQNVEALFAAMHLCVILRDNQDERQTVQWLEVLKKQYSSLVYRVLPGVWSPVSSSQIRNEIASTGHSRYLHRGVLKYILTNNVY